MAHTVKTKGSDTVNVTYYPSPISRTLPDWMFEFEIGLIGGEQEMMIGQLLSEVYAAVRGGQYRLATMGIRAVLEQVMIAKVGDHQIFAKTLERFHDNGYISLIQHDALNDALEAGHAATHRFFNPTEQDLDIILNIAEGILAAVYIHPHQGEFLSKRVPPRTSNGSDKKKGPT